jgi:hypothetical protein
MAEAMAFRGRAAWAAVAPDEGLSAAGLTLAP